MSEPLTRRVVRDGNRVYHAYQAHDLLSRWESERHVDRPGKTFIGSSLEAGYPETRHRRREPME